MLGTQIILTLSILVLLSPLYLHELGHYAALRRYGVPVVQYWIGLGPVLFTWQNIKFGLFPIGAAVVPEPESYATLSDKQRMIVALAGPVFSLGTGLIFLSCWLAAPDREAYRALLYCSALNFFIGGLNLLPIPPLDGYHALTSWLRKTGHPLSSQARFWLTKLGSAVVYGAGAYFITDYIIRAIRIATAT